MSQSVSFGTFFKELPNDTYTWVQKVFTPILYRYFYKKQIYLQAQVFYARYNFSGGSETTNLISPGKYTATRKSYESHPHGLKSLLNIGV